MGGIVLNAKCNVLSAVVRCTGRVQWYQCYYPHTFKRLSGVPYVGCLLSLMKYSLSSWYFNQ